MQAISVGFNRLDICWLFLSFWVLSFIAHFIQVWDQSILTLYTVWIKIEIWHYICFNWPILLRLVQHFVCIRLELISVSFGISLFPLPVGGEYPPWIRHIPNGNSKLRQTNFRFNNFYSNLDKCKYNPPKLSVIGRN